MSGGERRLVVVAGLPLRTWLDLLLVTLLALPLATPLLRWGQVACTHDGHLHYHRVVAMLGAWRNGLYFSRWLPDLAFGYGYPFFLYREPLPLYLTLWSHLLGLPMPAAINFFYILCILASGWFTYLWVRDIFNARAALVSAVAYMTAPYQLVDALVRGNQVESMALALFPLILWAARRFMLTSRARWFLTATLGLAVLALSHNISLLLFAPALVLYLLFVGRMAELAWKPIALRLLLVVGLGLGLTAFYTAPALLEIDEVTLTLSTANRNNDFHFNFASLSEILAPVASEDPTLINPPLPLRLGWAPLSLALLGVISLAWNPRREQRLHVVYMAAGAALYLFFSLSLTEPLWETLPLIKFVQFPWRFVGRAALPVAVLAGAPFAAQRPSAGIFRLLPVAALTAAAIVLLVVEAIPLLYPAFCVEEPYPTIQDVHEYERNSGLVGVDPVGSYFPVTVHERPQTSPLLEDYAAGRAPQRFDDTALPADAAVLQETYAPLRAQIEVQSPTGFEARYLTFAFPGWAATVDGEAVPITAQEPSGLITFPVPAGQHTIVIKWVLTPLRAAMGGASALAVIGVLAVALYLHAAAGGAVRDRPQQYQQYDRSGRSPTVSRFLLLGALALFLLAAKLLLVDRMPTPLRRSAAPPVAHTTDLAAGGLRLTGYNLSRRATPSGGSFDIDLAWQVQSTPALALQSNVWLRDAQGLIWSDRETFRPRIYEETTGTQQWQAGQWAWDSREVRVLPGTPPGRYEIVLTLFNLADLQPLSLIQPDNNAAPTAVIGAMEVVRRDEVSSDDEGAPELAAFRPHHLLEEEVGGLWLLGYNQDRATAAPGDPVLLTLFWQKPESDQSPAAGGAATTLTLSLRDPVEAVIHSWQIPPVRADYPPEEWQDGERVRGQHLLRLPASLETGEYQFWLQETPLGALHVEAPQRLLEEPPYSRAVDQVLGEQARLVGYSIVRSSAPPTMTVTLVWQGLREMKTSYRVFVHLVDGAGNIVAQSDAEPARWTRPTTGWAAGEYVIDPHVLSLPEPFSAADLALRVGLYDAGTGQRLPLPDGADFVSLQP